MQTTTTGEAYRALREHIAAVQRDDPLTAVTVLVPSFAVGRDVSRHLAAHGGAVNVSAVTLSELAARLVGPAFAPRRAATTPVVAAAVRAVLAQTPGVFAEVADQPGTVAALTRACAWLGGGQIDPALSSGTVTDEVLRIHLEVSHLLAAEYYTHVEVLTRALDQVPTAGHTVVFLPEEPIIGSERNLHARISAQAHVIDVDAPATGTEVIHASDPDDEVRTVVRAVREEILAGTAAHRIGVFFSSAEPYRALLARHLDSAEIGWYGTDPQSPGDLVLARTVLRLLDLRAGAIDRAELSALLDAGALRWTGPDGTRLSPREFDRFTCHRMPIVGGDDWARLNELDPADLPESSRDRTMATAASISALTGALDQHLTAIHTAESWTAAAAALGDMIDGLLPVQHRTADQRPHLDAALAALPTYETIGAPVGPEAVHAAVTDLVDTGRTTRGAEAVGVRVGDLAEGAGRDLDAVFVLGMAEGFLPTVGREDPLLPSSLTGTGPAERLAVRSLHARRTIASAAARRVCTFPRGDLRGGGEKVPSRWLLPTLNALTGRQVDQVGWDRDVDGCAQVIAIDSFAGALLTPRPGGPRSPATDTEWQVRRFAETRDTEAGMPDGLGTALTMREDRRTGRFTRFTGRVGDAAAQIDLFDAPVAPTRLEEWVISPYLFFLHRVLRAQILPEPDEDVAIEALGRGNLIHDVLEHYVLARIERAGVPDGDDDDDIEIEIDEETDEHQDRPGAPDRALLAELLTEAAAEAFTAAPGWLPQLWARDLDAVAKTVDRWFDKDAAEYLQGWRPTGAEQHFPDETAVSVDIGDREIAFTGKIDRIDRHQDGTVQVTDYKTGSPDRYETVGADDPTGGGTHFQLPVYGLYARTLTDTGQVQVRYQFLKADGATAEVGYPITDAVIDRLRADVATVYRAISAGVFPLKPGSFATGDIQALLGTTELARSWRLLRDRPELAEVAALLEGEQE